MNRPDRGRMVREDLDEGAALQGFLGEKIEERDDAFARQSHGLNQIDVVGIARSVDIDCRDTFARREAETTRTALGQITDTDVLLEIAWRLRCSVFAQIGR